MTELRITLIRHGNTDANNLRILQGQTDTLLSSLGHQQAILAGERLAEERFDRIYSSDLQRCQQTTRAISVHHPNTPMQLMAELRERSFGGLSGQPVATVFHNGECNDDFIASHGGETTDQFRERVRRGYQKLVQDSMQHKDHHVLVVTHGGPLSSLSAWWVNQLQYQVADDAYHRQQGHTNTAITTIQVLDNHMSGKIILFNSSSHLTSLADHESMQNNPPPSV
ncbi:PGAM-domain-containing protein [Hesseltinella vesiculosa]|uniref:PGAM-domain-containing protein n=1 Tax=Hesseltinella vesiculosa TaxID=101127 RepID=A0A1X2GBK8_9FUNG|nr:PGAM-domain-containing protein [Hesseltinella vesiculosa]